MADEPYVIWSNEHRAWWGHNRCGYTPVLAFAGNYNRTEAFSIVQNALFGRIPGGNPPEIAIPFRDAVEQFRR